MEVGYIIILMELNISVNFYYINGKKYIGEYTNGRREGYGVEYSENNLIKLLKYGKSKIIHSYGPYF